MQARRFVVFGSIIIILLACIFSFFAVAFPPDISNIYPPDGAVNVSYNETEGINTSFLLNYSNFTENFALEEYYNDPFNKYNEVFEEGYYLGQQITIGENGNNRSFILTNISVQLRDDAFAMGTYNFIIKHGNETGMPIGDSISFGQIPAADVPDAPVPPTWMNINMSPVLLEKGEKYCLLSWNEDGHFLWDASWESNDTGTYPGGDLIIYSEEEEDKKGGPRTMSWSTRTGEDLLFELYGISDFLNLIFLSNSSGMWQEYYNVTGIIENGTYYFYNKNFSSPATTYYWMVNATADEENSSGVLSFTTRGSVPSILTNESTHVEETTATINGFLADYGYLPTTCYFLWDTVSPPVANNESQGIITNATEFSKGLTGLTKGELYYFDTKAHNSLGWNNSGGILTFLTKPDGPTNLQLVNETGKVNVTWTVGAGSDRTVIVRKQDFNPANRFDGTEIYNGTGTQYTDAAVSVANHYYYRAWSYCSEGGLFQFSDDSAQADTIAANPALFDVHDIVVADNIISDLQIFITVENVGDLIDDVTMVWTLKRVDTGVLLDAGADTFAVAGHSEALYAITPSTTYIGLVNITFTADGDATTSGTFYTRATSIPSGPGYSPPTPPEEIPDELVPVVVEAGLPLILVIPVFIAVVSSFILFLIWKRRKKEK